jgi:tetratricopeptide (TPR) repeat protein
VYFADIASDASCQATALISLANTHFYSASPETAARVYEKGLALQETISPLLRSRMHAELSVVYGQMGRVQDAIRSAELSEENYPDEPEHDPSFLYAEFTPASLALEKGLAYVALAERDPSHDYQNRAADIFSTIDEGGSMPTPDRIRFEVANNQARAAVLLDDVDAFEAHMIRGLEGVALLGSNQRRREARIAWQRATEKWPHERRIDSLQERLQLTRGNS